jgi:erythromycin esterase
VRHLFPLTIIAVAVLASSQTIKTISRSTNEEATLAPNTWHDYSLRLNRGESAAIVVHQEGVDVVVDVLTPDGKLENSIDSPTGRTGDENVEVIAQQSGDYVIRVRPIDASEPTGKYRLEVTAIRTAAETDKMLDARQKARDEAAAWLKKSSMSLPMHDRHAGPLDRLVFGARVIALGEATHGSREFGDIRLSLTKYLIEHHGFRVIALEASMTKIRLLRAYLDGNGQYDASVRELAESFWIGRRTRHDLLTWVHEWNIAHPKDKVRVIGVDAQDNAPAREFLKTFVPKAYGEQALESWNAAEKELSEADEQTQVFGDSSVNSAARQAAAELLASLTIDRRMFLQTFGSADTNNAITSARELVQFSEFNAQGSAAFGHSRDWYMAINVLNSLEESRPDGRIIYWAHNAHIAHPAGTPRTTGAFLKSIFGCKYKAVALTFDSGAFLAQIPNDLRDRLKVTELPAAPPDSIESVARLISNNKDLLTTWQCDTQKGQLPQWLQNSHPLHWVGALYDPQTPSTAAFRPFNLTVDFDALAYFNHVTAEDVPTDRHLIPARKH